MRAQLYDSNSDGLLSAEDLSGLMAAVVGVAQYNIAEMYSELTNRGQPTEGEYKKTYNLSCSRNHED